MHPSIFPNVVCPPFGGAAPPIVLDRHIDASVDEELHSLIVTATDGELVQDACRLVRTPSRVDVRAVLEQKVGYGEMMLDHAVMNAARPGPAVRSKSDLVESPMRTLCSFRNLADWRPAGFDSGPGLRLTSFRNPSFVYCTGVRPTSDYHAIRAFVIARRWGPSAIPV
jgi:hypothetical protein